MLWYKENCLLAEQIICTPYGFLCLSTISMSNPAKPLANLHSRLRNLCIKIYHPSDQLHTDQQLDVNMTAPFSRLSTLTLFVMTFSLLVTGNDHSWYGRRRWNECWELSIPDSHIRVPFYHDYGKRSISGTLLARDKKPLHVPSESKNPAFEIPKTALEGANPRTWPGEKGGDWTPVLGADGPFGGVANEEFSASKEFGERPGRDSSKFSSTHHH